jgi:hypothetical protein
LLYGNYYFITDYSISQQGLVYQGVRLENKEMVGFHGVVKVLNKTNLFLFFFFLLVGIKMGDELGRGTVIDVITPLFTTQIFAKTEEGRKIPLDVSQAKRLEMLNNR